MSKVYIVLQRNYEYDDSNYDVGYGGNTIKAFSSKKDAEVYKLYLIAQLLKDGLYMYEYTHHSVFQSGVEIGDVYLQLDHFDGDDLYNFIQDVRKFSLEDRVKVARVFKEEYEPYFVEEVEIES